MMREIAQNGQMRAIVMAVAGAIIAAAATMFVPTAILETITGSTGLSELVPATAAPLGDTARALIAFGTGVLTLAVLAVMLSRSGRVTPRTERSPAVIDDVEKKPSSSLHDRLRAIKLPQIALPKMPWIKGENDITELSDLPKLRGGDVHPDAPPRRPLIATEDLPELDLATAGTQLPEWTPTKAPVIDDHVATDAVESGPVEAAPVDVEPVEFAAAAAAPAFAEPAAVVEPLVEPAHPEKGTVAQAASDHQPTLADMVAKLEAAVAQRHEQLRALEATAVHLAQPASAESETAAPETTAADEASEPSSEPTSEIIPPDAGRPRPPLEAVASTTVRPHDMDAALTAALETLQRMNAANR